MKKIKNKLQKCIKHIKTLFYTKLCVSLRKDTTEQTDNKEKNCRFEKLINWLLVIMSIKNINMGMSSKQTFKENKKTFFEDWGNFFLLLLNSDNFWTTVTLFFLMLASFWIALCFKVDGYMWVNILTTVSGAVGVNRFSSHVESMKIDKKLKLKADSATRNIENILMSIALIKKSNKLDENLKMLEIQTISALEDWKDIIPDINYKSLVNQMTELNNKITELENDKTKVESDKNKEISELKHKLQEQVNSSRILGWNSAPIISGGTASSM